MLIDLFVRIERWRKYRVEEQRRKEEEERKEARRRELERHAAIEKARADAFNNLALRRHQAQVLRAFMSAVRDECLKRHGMIDPASETGQWLQWAEQHAESIESLSAEQALPGYSDAERRLDEAAKREWWRPSAPR